MRAPQYACAVVVCSVVVTACSQLGDPSAPASTTAPPISDHSADVLPLVSLSCGAQITGDVRLDNDLTCVGNALLVAGDDITIDLNGHTLTGNGTGNGIIVSASHRVIWTRPSPELFRTTSFARITLSAVARESDSRLVGSAIPSSGTGSKASRAVSRVRRPGIRSTATSSPTIRPSRVRDATTLVIGYLNGLLELKTLGMSLTHEMRPEGSHRVTDTSNRSPVLFVVSRQRPTVARDSSCPSSTVP